MDPNETLVMLREWARSAYAVDDEDPPTEAMELFQALDEWLSSGGFLPTDWDERQAGVRY